MQKNFFLLLASAIFGFAAAAACFPVFGAAAVFGFAAAVARFPVFGAIARFAVFDAAAIIPVFAAIAIGAAAASRLHVGLRLRLTIARKCIPRRAKRYRCRAQCRHDIFHSFCSFAKPPGAPPRTKIQYRREQSVHPRPIPLMVCCSLESPIPKRNNRHAVNHSAQSNIYCTPFAPSNIFRPMRNLRYKYE